MRCELLGTQCGYSFFVLDPVSQNSGPEPPLTSNSGSNQTIDEQQTSTVKKYAPGYRKSATLIYRHVWASWGTVFTEMQVD